MLRNKIGKPSQIPSNSQTNKGAQTKIQSVPGSVIKGPGGIGTSFGGLKPPGLIGVKPVVKPSTPANLPTTGIQTQMNVSSQKQIQTPLSQKPLPTRTQQIKTQQQRLAELVNKRAAQMKKEYQMINKISSQVGTDKKSYFKQFQTIYGHVLNIFNRKSKKDKENFHSSQQPKKQNYQNQNHQGNLNKNTFWRINAWDDKDQLKQYLNDNFKKENYL